MIFEAPAFLYALALLAIPIIIHLFSFYVPKKVIFTNVRFLKELKQENKRVSRIRNWILLFLRCTALAALVIAFAEPIIPKGSDSKSDEVIGVYLDNSFSMSSGSIQTSNFYSAKAKAKKIAESFPENKKFVLASNDFISSKPFSKQAYLDKIENIEISAKPGNWNAIENIKLKSNKISSIVVLSDFQKTNFTDNLPTADSTSLLLVKFEGQINSNVSIDSLALSVPMVRVGQNVDIHVWITNNGSKDIEKLPVNISLNNSTKAPVLWSGKAKEQNQITFPVIINEPGIVNGKVSLNDAPITYDNDFYFSFEVSNTQKVFNYGNEKNPFLERLFASDTDFEFNYRAWQQMNMDGFENNQNTLFITNINSITTGVAENLKIFVANGGNVAIALSNTTDQSSWQVFFNQTNGPVLTQQYTEQTALNALDDRDIFFQPLFASKPEKINWPTINSHWETTLPFQAKSLVETENNNPFLIHYPYQKGNVFVFTSALNAQEGTFVNHGLFTPIILRITEFSGARQQAYAMLGKDKNYMLSFSDSLDQSTLKLEQNNQAFLPVISGNGNNKNCYLENLPLTAGWYNLTSNNSNITSLAFNTNRQESDISFLNEEALKTLLPQDSYNTEFHLSEAHKDVASAQLNITNDILWPYFVGLAILLLIIEMLWIKWTRKQVL